MSLFTLGFVVAEPNEFEPLRARAVRTDTVAGMTRCLVPAGQGEVSALLCGVGTVNAATAATVLAMQGASALFSVGYSGGMSKVQRHQTVAGTAFVEHDFDLTPLGYEKGVKPQPTYLYQASALLNARIASVYPDMTFGPMVSGDCFVCSDVLRRALVERYDAIACDMETSAVASVCEQFGLPFAAIRRISDDAGDNADRLYRTAVGLYEEDLMDMALRIAAAVQPSDLVKGDRCGSEK